MIEVLSRKLRVRDDGTGKKSKTNCLFSDYESEDAIILLGDPGMGKTMFFRHAAKGNFKTVRNFLIDPKAIIGEPIFLDALDEHRSQGQDASSEIAKALCSINKPKFRLSCRAADWFGAIDQETLRVASASGRLIILELLPLTRNEINAAINGEIQNPDEFYKDVEKIGLGDLLGNPQTLKLLVSAWRADKKPQNKYEVYESGISELIKEINTSHINRNATSPNTEELRSAAGAAFSTLLLSNSIGVSRTEPATGEGYFGLSIVPRTERDSLGAALKRRLFISAQTDRFEPIHRTIAEFLAAEDLSKRIVNDSLPIERVLALICGIDGKPISSLRGLFAWLMCKIGHIAESYVERDPYAIASYGDASMLPPNAQNAIWISLSQLSDPWFLTSEDDRGSFRELANPNTSQKLQEILRNTETGVHLKIAVLEAIANSTENLNITVDLKKMVLEIHDNTWFRSAALKAYIKTVQNDSLQINNIEEELTRAINDPVAPKLRVDLLCMIKQLGNLGTRILSILEQATNIKEEDRVVGHFYPLIDLPSDTDLEILLDGANEMMVSKSNYRYEFRSIFGEWLNRRLETSGPISSSKLANWLQKLPLQKVNSEKTNLTLKAIFEKEPILFIEVFEYLCKTAPDLNYSFFVFIAHDIWELLPETVWPVAPYEIFLSYAEKEANTNRAANFFQMYLNRFPLSGANVALSEAGIKLLNHRNDIANILGDWTICKIEKWRKEQWNRSEKERCKIAEIRKENVTFLTPRLDNIRNGVDEQMLVWAAEHYLGIFYDNTNHADARERLLNLTDDVIVGALIQGIIKYTENPHIQEYGTIIEKWLANRYHRSNSLLCLSVFLRISEGMGVPESAIRPCIAAVVTKFQVGDEVPGYDETLSAWLILQIRQNPIFSKSVLKDVWVQGAKNGKAYLPALETIEQNPDTYSFLASLAADVLKTGINDNSAVLRRLVAILLFHDHEAISSIGKTELSRNDLTSEARAIWSTALFIIDPKKYLEAWRELLSDSKSPLWDAIDIIKDVRPETVAYIRMSSAQRAEVIKVIGQRCPYENRPNCTSYGNQNPWDATNFVTNQINLLAADMSPDAGVQLAHLEKEDSLLGYHDLIRHNLAQHEKQIRETTFQFPEPVQVAKALANQAPATSADLLALIVDHFNALSLENRGTQTEGYRAYWNEDGRKLIEPKWEEVCSGFLAKELQNRVQGLGLIITVEHHMVENKECDIVVLQGTQRLLPIEVKHHYNKELWSAWDSQLDRLYTNDAKAGGYGIYLVLWSGEATSRKMPKLPAGHTRPTNANDLKTVLESLIPEGDRFRLRIVVVDISEP